jgi:hypothetical protein
MSEHAKLSPSGAEKWMSCPGSAALEAGEPDSSNDYSDEGTAAHFLASECLVTNLWADGFTGQTIGIWGGRAAWLYGGETPNNQFTVDDDMANHVNVYVHKVREYADNKSLMVEQRMGIGHLTGEKDACGTADAVVIDTVNREIIVIDLKYGMREVDGERNKQLMIYALAALEKFSMYEGEFVRVRTVIIQPRIGHFPEWSCSVDELMDFGIQVRAAAMECHKAVEFSQGGLTDMRGWLVPGAHCQKNYCKARAKCPALRDQIAETVFGDFENLDQPIAQAPVPVEVLTNETLAHCLSKVSMIEDWCKAVRAKVEAELFAGRPVPGYKLVQGKKGNRQWSDKEQAEATMKAFKLKVEEMYDLKLISPTTAEKLAKSGTIGPRQWPKLNTLVTQSEGSPSVAPESDKRPAIDVRPNADDFEDVSEPSFADML